MTNKELDEARGVEAWRLASQGEEGSPLTIAARLGRKGWQPGDPEDRMASIKTIDFRDSGALAYSHSPYAERAAAEAVRADNRASSNPPTP